MSKTSRIVEWNHKLIGAFGLLAFAGIIYSAGEQQKNINIMLDDAFSGANTNQTRTLESKPCPSETLSATLDT